MLVKSSRGATEIDGLTHGTASCQSVYYAMSIESCARVTMESEYICGASTGSAAAALDMGTL